MNPGVSHFWPQDYNLNRLGRGPLGDASYQISRLVVSDKKIFFHVSPYVNM